MEYEQLMLFMKMLISWYILSSIMMYFSMVEARSWTHPTRVARVYNGQVTYLIMILILIVEMVLIYFLKTSLSKEQGLVVVLINSILSVLIEFRSGAYSSIKLIYECFYNLIFNLSIQK